MGDGRLAGRGGRGSQNRLNRQRTQFVGKRRLVRVGVLSQQKAESHSTSRNGISCRPRVWVAVDEISCFNSWANAFHPNSRHAATTKNSVAASDPARQFRQKHRDRVPIVQRSRSSGKSSDGDFSGAAESVVRHALRGHRAMIARAKRMQSRSGRLRAVSWASWPALPPSNRTAECSFGRADSRRHRSDDRDARRRSPSGDTSGRACCRHCPYSLRIPRRSASSRRSASTRRWPRGRMRSPPRLLLAAGDRSTRFRSNRLRRSRRSRSQPPRGTVSSSENNSRPKLPSSANCDKWRETCARCTRQSAFSAAGTTRSASCRSAPFSKSSDNPRSV